MAKLRVAIVGVGNCATSLIQGVEYYKNAEAGTTVPGLMHVQFGDYHISDIEFVAAFDVDSLKVGKELVEATQSSENNTIKICDVPKTDIQVLRGHTLDGLLECRIGKAGDERIAESDVDQGNDDNRDDATTAHLLVSVSHPVPSLRS